MDGSTSTEASEQREARLPYLGGLDGLRAIAVIGVLLYHAGLPLRGGFLGVETFFALSGFLITALLLSEWNANGRIDIVAFWRRRALRLLPALVLVLVAAWLFTALALPEELSELRGDALASLAYVMNWHLVSSQQSYFDPMLRPPLLQHLWSLAVEEQFYVFWPLLFIAGIRLLRRNGFLLIVLAAATASIAWMASMYEPGADPSRAYYGTDTRAGGLLLGAALALVWSPWRAAAPSRKAIGTAWDAIGLAAIGGLLWSYVALYESHPLLYRGGFALVSVATAAVIAAVTHPAARLLPAVLSWRPLRWVGARSYGLYLWHWPIFMATSSLEGALSEAWLLALRFGLVLALATLSYHFVEMPVRRGALGQLWSARPSWLRPALSPNRPVLSARWRVPTVLAAVMVFNTTCTGSARPPDTSGAAVATSIVAAAPAAPAPSEAVTAATVAPTQTAQPTEAAPPTETPEPSSTPEPTEVVLEQIDPALAESLQAILDSTVADGSIPGVSLAVSIPGYEPWVGTSGVSSRETQTPMDPATEMRIASISKVFTAATVLTLVEEGKIDLDAPVSTWFPDLLPQGDSIRVRDLLQHTSGLYDFLEDRSYVTQAYQNPDRAFEPRELVEYAAQFPLAFAPGAEGAWDYSSTNYVLLGMIVEEVTGSSLAAEMRKRVVEPLGLTQTFFAPDEAISGVQADGYSRTIKQTAVAMSFGFATANVVSTPSDVRRFAEALFTGGLLQPETLEQMLTFVNGKGQYNMPALAYGFGVMRNELAVGAGPDGQPRAAEDITVLGHIGGFGGFRSAVWHAPASGITIALGVNQASTDPNILATEVWDAVLASQGK